MNQALLRTEQLTRRFDGLIAVDHVDFELPEGEIRALIGPNGAGKSTFVGLLCGRIEASGGRVFFAGNDVTKLPAHQRIGMGIAYTFQITSVFARLSMFENVALAVRRAHGGTPAAVRQRVHDALSQVGLVDFTTAIAGDQSYGHQRLLEIAMGLAQTPRLFILDEPTQGLSEAEIDNFMSLIRGMAGQTTILLIEHNMDVVMQTAERITVLDNGAVLAEGRPDEIRANPAVQAAYLGTTGS